MSKAAPTGQPSLRWTMVAVAGKVWSPVVVATTIRSTSSGVRPAASSARRAAATARADTGWPSAARGGRRGPAGSGGHGEVRYRLAVGGAVALADAGAFGDPGVGGVHQLGQFVIGDDPVRQVAAYAGHDATLDDGHLNPSFGGRLARSDHGRRQAAHV